MEEKNMKQMIADFKAIMADKNERIEFIGGLACAVAVLAVLYMAIVIFH